MEGGGLFEETTDVQELLEDYDDEIFWHELAERLGGKDFMENYSEEEVAQMSKAESFTLLYRCIDKYNEEFEDFGLERIKIIKNITKKITN